MTTESIWAANAGASHHPQLAQDVSVDVVIVGGGITGLTAAALLADAGRSVAVLEARRIGEGTTGNSTGNLYAVVSSGLHGVRETWNDEVMRNVAASRSEAVDFIEQVVAKRSLDCGYARRAMHFFATTPSRQQRVGEEHEAAMAAGLTARLESDTSILPVTAAGDMLVIEGQAQLDPLRYVRALAQAVAGERCRIYEHTPAIAIDHDQRCVETPRGKVSAREVVLATHTPKGIYAVQTEMKTHREYGVAWPLEGAPPPGIYWGVGDYNQSFRLAQHDGRTYGVLVGPEHKTGAHDAQDALQRLESHAAQDYRAAAIAFRWSAQNYHGTDHLPYIGRTHGSDAFIATGFATDGLVYGTLAARIVADEIVGKANRWAKLYDAKRFDPGKSGKGLVQENIEVAKGLLQRLSSAERSRLDEIAPGSARIVEVGGHKVAAYRDESGALHPLSPVCPHLHCEVAWNGAEKSWDCPCHGSRFDVAGCPIEGPALKGLAPYGGERGTVNGER